MAGSKSNTSKWYYHALYGGKTVRVGVELSDYDKINDLARQLPELDIEFNEAELDEGRPYAAYSTALEPSYQSEWAEGYWSVGGVEMSESDLYDHLMAVINWFDEPIEFDEFAEATCIPLDLQSLTQLVLTSTKFVVTFSDPSTGMQGTMTCRKSVPQSSTEISDADKNLFTVYDMTAKDYRSIPVDTILTLKIRRQLFRFKEAV